MQLDDQADNGNDADTRESKMLDISEGLRSWWRVQETYNPPRRKRPETAIFRPSDWLSFQMYGIGSERMKKSVQMLGTELPSKKAVLLTQWPPWMVRSHQYATGVQEKMETKTYGEVMSKRNLGRTRIFGELTTAIIQPRTMSERIRIGRMMDFVALKMR